LGKALIAIGAIISLSAVIGWAIEPLEEPMEPHEDLQTGGEPGGVVIETADFLSERSTVEEVKPDE
jgi:hypothetical protein